MESGASDSGGRLLDFHPGMGMRWEVTRGAAEGSDDVFESVNWIDPDMPGPPTHVHPISEESFEVLEGSLEVCVDGEWTTLGPGDSATVPKNVPHTLRNGGGPTKAITRIRPAGNSEEFFRRMHGLIHEGKIKQLPPKDPRSAIYAAMLFARYPDEIRATGPLAGVFKALSFLGRMLRFEL